MMLRVQLLESFAGDVGIDLGSGDIGVAKQHLHHAQIRTMIE